MSASHLTMAQRRSVFLRVHFWAALIASPFAIVAALTGLLYVFTPQIEAALYGQLDKVLPAGQRLPLDEVVQAARNVAPPGLNLRSVSVPIRADESIQVVFSPSRRGAAAADGAAGAGHGSHAEHGEHAGHGEHAHGPAVVAAVRSNWGDRIPRGTIVYVNPYTAQVLGSLGEMERFNLWARRLHSSLLQGDGWRWPIELSASWLMVMLLTGIYLWWPRGAASALPVRGARGRVAWKQWHAFAGVALSVMSLVILATGLTWSRYAGDQIRALRDAAGQASPTPPRGLSSAPASGRAPLSWEAMLQAAREQASAVPMQFLPPQGERGVWRIGNVDRGQPFGRFTLVLDATSGRTLFAAGWDQQTAFGKATAIGIPFHRGELGWWNQALLFAFGAGVLFSLVSGWVMFFKRRRQGFAVLPRLLPGAGTSLPAAAWLIAVPLLALLPLLAASAALVALVEVMLHSRRATPLALLKG